MYVGGVQVVFGVMEGVELRGGDVSSPSPEML